MFEVISILELPSATQAAVAATIIGASIFTFSSRTKILSCFLSKISDVRVIIADIKVSNGGLVLKNVNIAGVEVGAIIIRGTMQDLWQAFTAAKNGEPIALSKLYFKDFKARVHRSRLISLMAKAQSVGFSVQNLKFINMELEISGGSRSSTNPTVLIQRLELEKINHTMTPAEVAASITHLKETCVRARVGSSSLGSSLQVQRRHVRTTQRVEGMNLQTAIVRVLGQLDQIPSVTQGSLAPLLQPLVQMVAVQKLASSRDLVGDVGRLALQSIAGSRQWTASASNLRFAQANLTVVQELVSQGVIAKMMQEEERVRRLVDALQPEGALLPALAKRGHLVSSLVHQKVILSLIDQGFLDLLLERRELLLKLLESQVLETAHSSGALKVLMDRKSIIFQQLITGHAVEVLIDTNVLQPLLIGK
eukprot:CAMPEP_0196592658 /NCGR_PEP_ID=MMETSP1081-20130531/73400_1 /TAXON_ID=36882 /ORGANISM="Pyramimonas amylifera, Strain CCMP720" /LENGTH=421 /DNA_ID=CAMNT_0041916407 /DNA_START=411 /DNA_END=1676 /DNA_ORIENTATION=-